MKNLKYILLLVFFISSCGLKGQLKDFENSIFFIVDKKSKNVTYKEGKIKGDFEIEIKCNYFKDTEDIYDDEYAKIYFHFEQNEKTVEEKEIYIDRAILRKIQTVDVEWVAQQESRETMAKKVPWNWLFEKGPNFVIFKEDLLSKDNKIKAYHVGCGEGDIEW